MSKRAGGKALADRHRHPRRSAGRRGDRRRGRALRRHRHPRQQRLGDQPHRHARHADEALRPDASDQHARHLSLHAEGRAASREIVEPARPQHLAAAAFDAEPAVVRAARRLHDGEVRHVACACSAWRRSFAPLGIAVNALWPRTTIDTEAIRLIAGQEARIEGAQPADHGRRRALDPHAAKPHGHRPILPRR